VQIDISFLVSSKVFLLFAFTMIFCMTCRMLSIIYEPSTFLCWNPCGRVRRKLNKELTGVESPFHPSQEKEYECPHTHMYLLLWLVCVIHKPLEARAALEWSIPLSASINCQVKAWLDSRRKMVPGIGPCILMVSHLTPSFTSKPTTVHSTVHRKLYCTHGLP